MGWGCIAVDRTFHSPCHCGLCWYPALACHSAGLCVRLLSCVYPAPASMTALSVVRSLTRHHQRAAYGGSVMQQVSVGSQGCRQTPGIPDASRLNAVSKAARCSLQGWVAQLHAGWVWQSVVASTCTAAMRSTGAVGLIWRIRRLERNATLKTCLYTGDSAPAQASYHSAVDRLSARVH